MPRVTAMCCANCVGDKLPLYIILPYLKKLPSEMTEFSENSQAYFSSSPSGWETRDTFLWFAIIFINWLSSFKLTLN